MTDTPDRAGMNADELRILAEASKLLARTEYRKDAARLNAIIIMEGGDDPTYGKTIGLAKAGGRKCMSTSDLRPGDRVKVLAAAYDEFVVFIGKIGTVDHVWSADDVGVSIDGEPSDTTYSFAEHELKRLITTPSAVNQVTGKK